MLLNKVFYKFKFFQNNGFFNVLIFEIIFFCSKNALFTKWIFLINKTLRFSNQQHKYYFDYSFKMTEKTWMLENKQQ